MKLDLPQAHTIAVAAAAVGRDHHALGCRITLLPHRPPTAAALFIQNRGPSLDSASAQRAPERLESSHHAASRDSLL